MFYFIVAMAIFILIGMIGKNVQEEKEKGNSNASIIFGYAFGIVFFILIVTWISNKLSFS